jgi:hypothetical protein
MLQIALSIESRDFYFFLHLPFILFYSILSYLSYFILYMYSYLILSYFILSYPILFDLIFFSACPLRLGANAFGMAEDGSPDFPLECLII